MTSPAAVQRLVRRLAPPQPRIGFVTAVDVGAQLVTVAFEDGSTTTSLSWASSAYTSPSAGDRVLVIPTSTGWVVSSKVTPRPQLVPDQQAVVPVRHNWQGDISDPDTQGAGWFWYDYMLSDPPSTSSWQGRVPPQQGGDGYVQTSWDIRASVLYWGALANLVPSGATISQVTLTLRAQWVQQGLVAPVLYAHAYTPGSPPQSTVWDDDFEHVITPGLPPSWVAGYGPLRFPRIATGEATVITIPATWVTAWLAGTITGLGLYSAANADGVVFEDAWHISADRQSAIFDTDFNADLTITYSGGTP